MSLKLTLKSITDYILSLEGIAILSGEILAILALTVVARYIQSRVFRKLFKFVEHKHRIWDNAIIFSLKKPVGIFIWLWGLTFAAQILEEYFKNPAIFSWIAPSRQIGTVVIFGWFLFRFVSQAEKNLINPPDKSKAVNKTTATTVGKILRVAIWVVIAIIVLQILNIPVTGILTLGSLGTVVFALAGKDVLANFFGGFMVFLDRPFAIGDWIRSPDRTIEGTVEHIGWRTTRIRQFDKRPLYVPNSAFVNISVENPSRMLNRRIREVVGIRYQDAGLLPTIVSEIEKMLREHPDLDPLQTTFVTFNHFGPSSLDCLVYCFTKTTQWIPYLKVQQDVFLKILEIVRKHGADVAFPTTTLDLPDGAIQALGERSIADK